MLETIGAAAGAAAFVWNVYRSWRERRPEIAVDAVEVRPDRPADFDPDTRSYVEPKDGVLALTIVNLGTPVTISRVAMIDPEVAERANRTDMTPDEAAKGRLDVGESGTFILYVSDREAFVGPVRFSIDVAGRGRYRSTAWKRREHMAESIPDVTLWWDWRASRAGRRLTRVVHRARWWAGGVLRRRSSAR